MGFELKEMLKSLCCTNGWSYGVFWRFNERNSMLLTLEDAYYEEQMGMVVNDMTLQVHKLGEGIIGQSALTGKHKWMFSDATQDIIQGEHEFHPQFFSGVKTILVVSGGSRGVVQFGSTQKMLENVEFLGQTRRLFEKMDSVNLVSENASSSLDSETCDLDNLFASLVPLGNCEAVKNLDLLHGFSFDEIIANPCSSTSSTHSSFTSEVHQGNMSSTYWDSSFVCEPFQTSKKQEFTPEESYDMHGVSEFKDYEFDTEILNSFSLDDIHQLLAQSPEPSMKTATADDHQEVQICSVSPSALLEDDVLPHCSDVHKVVSDDQRRSMIIKSGDNDLFDALGLNFGSQRTLDCPEESSLAAESGVSENKSALNKSYLACTQKGLFSELGLDKLISGVSNNSSSMINPSFEDLSYPTKRRKMESSPSNSSHVSQMNPSWSTGSMNFMQPLLHSWSKMKNNTSFKKAGLWIDDSDSINGGNVNVGQSKKPEETVKVTKKRAKPGESSRPRPKDRQMIQDRLKELRGIIPKGAKCSIDALLDLTIKHMLFLQSISKNADKLKQSYKPKLIDQQNGLPLKERVGGGNGATWAYEVGDQTTVCPIIVEDLSPPGQMLIEMLCEEQGHFLEIADAIKGFGLNILKGVMETRGRKIWAHFIIEAKGHVTRLDVFWSLVQLLQKPDSKCIDPTSQTANVTDPGIPFPDRCEQALASLPVDLAETLQ